MRVFVTLNDELYRALQDRALKQGLSFQAVINEVLQQGLTDCPPKRAAGPSKRSPARRPKKAPNRKPTTFDQLLDEL